MWNSYRLDTSRKLGFNGGESDMRLVDIKDVKQGFMEKTDLDEETIQSIIDELPTANDTEKVNRIITKIKKEMEECIGASGSYMDIKLQQWVDTINMLN